jgi:hypothetical protein
MRMAQINLSKARDLCTAPELRLVEASRPQAIRNLTEAQLKSKVARARALRDKWHDVFTRQRRQAQRDRRARAVAASDRSRQKSELFGDVLARFEAQLEKGAAAAGGSATPAGARPSREKRGRQHRRTRSRVRKHLAELLSAWESEGGSVARASTPAATGKTRTPASQERSRTGTEKSEAAPGTKGAKKKAAKPKRARMEMPAGGAVGKRRAQPVTKRDRILARGPSMRIRGHALARGRRAQARRDRRR